MSVHRSSWWRAASSVVAVHSGTVVRGPVRMRGAHTAVDTSRSDSLDKFMGRRARAAASPCANTQTASNGDRSLGGPKLCTSRR